MTDEIRIGDRVQVLLNAKTGGSEGWFEGTVVGGVLEAGDDADDVGFFALDALPELAFETDVTLLRRLGAALP